MNHPNYYDFTKIYGEDVENLLVKLKQLLLTQLNENNLPNNTKKEIELLNEKIENNKNKIAELMITDGNVKQLFVLLGIDTNNDKMNIIIDGGEYN